MSLTTTFAITFESELNSASPAASEAQPETLPEVAVTAIREEQLLGQVLGVALSQTHGEGHTTPIRQPFSTSPLYLFLEDGIPVRPTVFFNHNALYALNIPRADGVEVIRGPGSALYGSDGIGGVINVLSARPYEHPALTLNSEGGSFGWLRFWGRLKRVKRVWVGRVWTST